MFQYLSSAKRGGSDVGCEVGAHLGRQCFFSRQAFGISRSKRGKIYLAILKIKIKIYLR